MKVAVLSEELHAKVRGHMESLLQALRDMGARHAQEAQTGHPAQAVLGERYGTSGQDSTHGMCR